MKCVRDISTEEIKRVPDSSAEYLVLEKKSHVYVNKQTWKAEVRDSEKITALVNKILDTTKEAIAIKQKEYVKKRKERTNN